MSDWQLLLISTGGSALLATACAPLLIRAEVSMVFTLLAIGIWLTGFTGLYWLSGRLSRA